MKVLTILGTRPEIIRLSRVIAQLDALCEHTLVHTGQNYDPMLSDIFFGELDVRAPDHFLEVQGESLGSRIGQILMRSEELMRAKRPDRLLVLGDTDSALAAFMAKRSGIPVYHMEAGNRCFDDRVPEEVNRRVIDHTSDVLLPYTERSRDNLLREGIASHRIFVTGNPIYEVLNHHAEVIGRSDVVDRLELSSGSYFLATLHRQENVDGEERLRSLFDALSRVAETFGLPIICSLHPRTRDKIAAFGITVDTARIRLSEPFGFFDFVHLEQHARCALTDSGTVQEECCIFGVPTVTLRDTTERPETVECGSNILSGAEPDAILRCTQAALHLGTEWQRPREYLVPAVSEVIARILLGK